MNLVLPEARRRITGKIPHKWQNILKKPVKALQIQK